MTLNVYSIFFVLLCLLLGFKVYQLPQRFNFFGRRILKLSLDDRIPFKPNWVWIYLLAYYPLLVSITFFVNDWILLIKIVMNFSIILFLHVLFSFFLPVSVPNDWRNYCFDKNISTRMLSYIQRFDKNGNCFPSMHVAATVLGSYHLTTLAKPSFLFYIFILLTVVSIILSTVFTKQHLVVDIPSGVILGGLGIIFYFNFPWQILGLA